MALSEEQKRVDAALRKYIDKWNSLNDSQRKSVVYRDLKDRIVDLINRRNGAGGSDAIGKVLHTGAPIDPAKLVQDLDDKYPRIDGRHDVDSPSPSSAPAPAPKPDPKPDPRDTSSSAYDAEPGDDRLWLPGSATLPSMTDGDKGALNSTDAAIEQINQDHFHLDPSQAWKPSGAELPVTGTNISTLGDTHELAQKTLTRWQAAVDELTRAFGNGTGSGEQLIDDQYARIKSPLASLTDSAAASQELSGMVARSGIAANNAFHHQLRGSNLAARTAIGHALNTITDRTTATSNQLGVSPADVARAGYSHDEFASLPHTVETGAPAPSASTEANAIHQLVAKVPTPETVARENVPAPEHTGTTGKKGDNSGAGTPTSSTPSGGAHAAGPGGHAGATPGGKSAPGTSAGGTDLSKLLSQLANQAVPAAANPAAAVPQQAAQAAQQAAKPLTDAAQQTSRVPESLMKALAGQTPDNQKAHPVPDTAASKSANADRAAATSKTFTQPGSASPDKLGAPGSNARAHQLDANGRPVDKDHDGKVDKDATPLSKKTLKPFDLKVDTNGANHQVKGVPDPRVGEMMLNMAEAEDGRPMSVLDAAKASGMSIESLGDPIDPADAKVGHAVIGDEKSGLYVGDGDVLTSTGQIEKLDDVVGEDGFVSEIPLPDLPDDVPAPEAEPEVGTSQVPAPEPEPAPAPEAPEPAAEPAAEAVPAPEPAADPAPVAPAPAAAPVADPAADSGSADSGGPRQVAYEGRPLG